MKFVGRWSGSSQRSQPGKGIFRRLHTATRQLRAEDKPLVHSTVYKVPKEKIRIRTIELVVPALSLLKDQFASTGDLPPVTVEVFQRDNITSRNESVRFVFRNGASGEPWHPASVSRWFAGHLKRAGVRHRGPNQCRHTFASQTLSSYVPAEWVARQLGHTDTSMVRRHYGRWLPSDTRSMASLVSQMLGFDNIRS